MSGGKHWNAKIALLTGASSGIGAATALELARQGCRMALLARRKERLEALAQQITELGAPQPLLLIADIAKAEELAQVSTQLREWSGDGLDLLVHCAGIGHLSSLAETAMPEIRRVLEVNLLGTFQVLDAFLPQCRQGIEGTPGARVVLVSSTAGRRGMPLGAAYSASKAALEGLGDALRVELGTVGIGLTLVYPSLTRTEFFDHLLTGDAPSLEGKWSQSPEQVAQKIVQAATKGRRRKWTSWKGLIIYGISLYAPFAMDWLQGRKLPPSTGDWTKRHQTDPKATKPSG